MMKTNDKTYKLIMKAYRARYDVVYARAMKVYDDFNAYYNVFREDVLLQALRSYINDCN